MMETVRLDGPGWAHPSTGGIRFQSFSAEPCEGGWRVLAPDGSTRWWISDRTTSPFYGVPTQFPGGYISSGEVMDILESLAKISYKLGTSKNRGLVALEILEMLRRIEGGEA